jgi:hypothetical protein
MSTTPPSPFEAWCIVELLGHKTLAGFVTEMRIASKDFFAIQIHYRTGEITTEIFSPDVVYRLMPCTEETARMMAIQQGGGIGLYDARQLLASYDKFKERLNQLGMEPLLPQPALHWDEEERDEQDER